MTKFDPEISLFNLSVDKLNIKESELLKCLQNLLGAMLFLFHVLKNEMNED